MSIKSSKSLDSYFRKTKSKLSSRSSRRSRNSSTEEEFNLRSEIIILILAHGADLCSKPLPDYGDKLQNNTLVFTVADRGKSNTIGFPGEHTTTYAYNIIEKLFTRLHREKMPIYDVVRQMETEESVKQRELLKWMKQEKAYEHDLKIIESRIQSCEKGLVAKPRVLTIDREYDTLGVAGLGGIHILDIRNPKSNKQTNSERIQEQMEHSNIVKLSDILNICYKTYRFDYVTIFDFACRNSENPEICERGGCCMCKSCQEYAKEIQDGERMMRVFKTMKLGGGLIKRKLKRRTKRKLYKKLI